MKDSWHAFWRFLGYVLSPSFYRAALVGRIRIKVYLRNGQSIKFNVASANFTLGSNARYSLEDLNATVSIVPAEIVAWKEVLWW